MVLPILCLVLAAGPGEPSEAKIVLGEVTITLPKDGRPKITGVKTPDGPRVRVDVNGVAIEAPKLVVLADRRRITVTVDKDGVTSIMSEQLP